MEAKYKVGERIRFNHSGEGIREGTVFGTYNLKGELRYSIRIGSTFYTMNEDEIIEKVDE
jgi:hypothetical protein